MRHPAAVERRRPALKKEGSVPTRLADHTLLLQWYRYSESRHLRLDKYGCYPNNIFAWYKKQTIFDCTAALNSFRGGILNAFCL